MNPSAYRSGATYRHSHAQESPTKRIRLTLRSSRPDNACNLHYRREIQNQATPNQGHRSGLYRSQPNVPTQQPRPIRKPSQEESKESKACEVATCCYFEGRAGAGSREQSIPLATTSHASSSTTYNPYSIFSNLQTQLLPTTYNFTRLFVGNPNSKLQKWPVSLSVGTGAEIALLNSGSHS